MRLSNDLREFLESLNSRGVDHVVVGAHSLAFHVTPAILIFSCAPHTKTL